VATEGGEGGGDADERGGLDGGGGGLAVGEEGVHLLVLPWAAQRAFDVLEDGAGGVGEAVGVGLAEMVVGGDHACQPAEGGDQEVESVLLGVFFGFDEELDALFEQGDRVGQVEGVEAEGDLVLDAAGGR